MSYAYDRAKERFLETKPAMVCHYCHVDVEPSSRKWRVNSLTFDHVVPLSVGGLNDPSNLVVCCAGCNCLKGSLSYEEFSSKVKSVKDRDNMFIENRNSKILNKEKRNKETVVKLAVLFSFLKEKFNIQVDLLVEAM